MTKRLWTSPGWCVDEEFVKGVLWNYRDYTAWTNMKHTRLCVRSLEAESGSSNNSVTSSTIKPGRSMHRVLSFRVGSLRRISERLWERAFPRSTQYAIPVWDPSGVDLTSLLRSLLVFLQDLHFKIFKEVWFQERMHYKSVDNGFFGCIPESDVFFEAPKTHACVMKEVGGYEKGNNKRTDYISHIFCCYVSWRKIEPWHL